MVLGEYADGYGFLLPNPASMPPRIDLTTVESSVVHVYSKIEDAWCVSLGDLRSRIRFNLENTASERGSMGGVLDGVVDKMTVTRIVTCTFVTCTGTTTSGRRT